MADSDESQNSNCSEGDTPQLTGSFSLCLVDRQRLSHLSLSPILSVHWFSHSLSTSETGARVRDAERNLTEHSRYRITLTVSHGIIVAVFDQRLLF